MNILALVFPVIALVLPVSYADQEYDLEVTHQTETVRDGAGQTALIRLNEEMGMSLMTSRSLARTLGNTAKVERHPFDFARPERVTIKMRWPETHFVFSTFRLNQAGFEPADVAQFVIGLADKKRWQKYTL